ncbi:MgtC/SapB family protein [Edaphobacter albus]|uniref:MgtC/SapB family protein n=1 Tax=Edaphobacter sp. 4G125 TaxID=2763071 RepID=UPI00164558F7|nr:MgtC/SapB family protein [Edaphobacter sp. 4G125]QNI36100.1 MgtC/SapB family protein [Edaphobacter sp. 4G125]
MPVTVTWEQIALRILLATVASFLIGYNRDERGKSLGIRTTMLVCLAATLAMVQANLLMSTTGRASTSFITLDLMRLPLGILSGIGFIGAGAILRREDGLVRGVTTAATMWYVTVLGLLFGGGQLTLALVGTALAFFILWTLKWVEMHMPTHRTGSLSMQFDEPQADDTKSFPTEEELRQRLQAAGYSIEEWTVRYHDSALSTLECNLQWPQVGHEHPRTPELMRELAALPCVSLLCWRG